MKNMHEPIDLIKGANTWSKRPACCPSCDWCSELDETSDHGWICVNCKFTSYHYAAQKEPMNIIEFFDPLNKKHLQAFSDLQTTGSWPTKFWDEHLQHLHLPTCWQISLTSKIADAFIKEKLG